MPGTGVAMWCGLLAGEYLRQTLGVGYWNSSLTLEYPTANFQEEEERFSDGFLSSLACAGNPGLKDFAPLA
jgi:hypothetical protein